MKASADPIKRTVINRMQADFILLLIIWVVWLADVCIIFFFCLFLCAAIRNNWLKTTKMTDSSEFVVTSSHKEFPILWGPGHTEFRILQYSVCTYVRTQRLHTFDWAKTTARIWTSWKEAGGFTMYSLPWRRSLWLRTHSDVRADLSHHSESEATSLSEEYDRDTSSPMNK